MPLSLWVDELRFTSGSPEENTSGLEYVSLETSKLKCRKKKNNYKKMGTFKNWDKRYNIH